MRTAPGWDDPRTVAAWRDFAACSDRYDRVNTAIATAAAPGATTVLDVGAGTGGTARALLDRLDPGARITCVEPAAAMRAAAPPHPRVTWRSTLPDGTFSRVTCGAALWLLGPLEGAIDSLAARLAPGGALVFAMPATYLGEPDPPGGGPDPQLLDLPRALVADRTAAPAPGPALPDAAGLATLLRDAGLRPERWSVQTRWTLDSQAAWFKLPPVGGAMRPDLPVDALSDAVDRARARCAPGSWRPERWCGFTAWRHP